jgi:Leucine-rich repeat (LRR) protein
MKSSRSKINEIDELVQYELTKQGLDDIENNEFLSENCKIIEKLNFSNNNFKEITPSFLNFENLILLDISKNEICKIENLYNCVNLEVLIISYNKIKYVGTGLAKLKKLQHLDLKFNQIYINDTTIKSFKYNPELISLCIDGNLNYTFDEVKFKCLDFLKKIEYLENIQIYSKTGNKSSTPQIHVNTIKGDTYQVRTIKDYIKLKRKDLEENVELYTAAETNQNTASNIKYNNTSSYYFLNKMLI